jgi:uncharacterized protein with NAD-binding domain and iron-sulfur cluster
MAGVARKRVVILGGGIAGMSAAHELIERGFEVEVFERKPIPGGKARSIAATGLSSGLSPFGRSATAKAPTAASGPPLPGEHGFRFFPGFYRHVVDTMGRIPYGGGSVADNLVNTTELKIASFERPSFTVPARFPRTPQDLAIDLFAVISALSGQLGVPLDEGFFFATKMWQVLTSCEERRLVEYERTNWWDFIEADSRSIAYKKFFGSGITRSLVAAKARRASTKTIGDIFMQIVFEMLLPGVAADRVLNGPTNDVWIDPWLKHLRERGVVYHLNADVRAIHCDRGVVRSATVAIGGRIREVKGDHFIAALPVERMAELVGPDLLRCDPSLANIDELTQYVDWMSGIQYYLTEDIPIAHGHVIYIDSPWALTSVSQAQFWRDFDVSKYGDGAIRGILSVDISDWDVKGINGKEARQCSREEVAMDTWQQLKRSLNVGGEVLSDRRLYSWFLDPDIQDGDADGDPSTPRKDTNAEPLLVNYVDTWRLRPEAVTRIPNLFLASDYVRTFTDLATMEAANEAARRAVNGILQAARSDAEPCQVWNLHEPEAFLPFRAFDRVRYRKGLPWSGEAMALARSALNLASAAGTGANREDKTGPMQIFRESVAGILGSAPELVAMEGAGAAPVDGGSGRSPATTSADDAVAAAAEARASSDEGLRRLRVVRPGQ